MKFSKLLIVIPTRNRAKLAINAINSVLSQNSCNFQLLVSDNSTEESEIAALKDYCQKTEDKRLIYIRPPKPLPMTEHWNWVLEKGMEIPVVSHIALLSDRMQFLKESLSQIQNILVQVDSEVVSYCTDVVVDYKIPVVLWQMQWSDKLYEVDSSRLIKYFAEAQIIYHPLPRMFNCTVSKSLLNQIHSKFGNYFSSVSPDFNFAFRVLETFDSIYFYDRVLMIQYGSNQSNGVSIMKGEYNKAAQDFITNLNVKTVNFETPVNSLFVLPNAILHEYYEVKRNSVTEKFPEFNKEKYLTALVNGVFNYGDLNLKEQMLKELKISLGNYSIMKYRLKHRIQRYKHAINIRLAKLRHPSNPFLIFSEFQTVEQAINHANNFPRKPYDLLELSKENFPNSNVGVKVILERIGSN